MKTVRKLISLLIACTLAATALPMNAATSVSAAGSPVKVACCGDSITQGWASSNTATCSYPAQLQNMLGDGYDVRNYGSGGLTAMKNYGSLVGSYWTYGSFYKDSQNFRPDIVILKLGTNDAVVKDGGSYRTDLATQFHDDLKALVESYQALASKPTVYLCTPMTAFDSEHPTRVQNIIVPAVKTVASETGATLLDFNAYSADYKSRNLTNDGIHPNDAGYIDMAGYMYENVFGFTLRRLTVLTEKGNIVSLGGQKCTAGSDGKATILTGDGKKTIRVEKKGVGYADVEVTVTKDEEVDLRESIKITANLALLDTTAVIDCGRKVDGDDFAAKNINDGDESTGWQLSGDGSDFASGVWVGYDFGAPKKFNGVEIVWEEATRGTEGKYTIETSDNGTTWTKLNAAFSYGTDRDGVTFDAVTARYIRVNITAAKKIYPKVYEFRVFAAADEEKPTSNVKGDVDLDGEVGATDLTILARHVADIERLTEGAALLNGDMDTSGGIGADDLTALARLVAHID